MYSVAALNGLAPDGPRRCPQLQLNAQETEDLTAYADALPKLVSIGVQPTRKWAHEKLGIPMPQDGEAVLAPSAQAPASGPLGATDLGAALAAAAALPTGVAQTPPVAMATRLSDSAAPAVDGWIDQIRALVDRAASLEEIRDGLQALLPDMTLDQYAAAMAQALAAAQLAGRYEVLQEAGGPHG